MTITKELRETAERLREEGFARYEIAAKLGISTTTVGRALGPAARKDRELGIGRRGATGRGGGGNATHRMTGHRLYPMWLSMVRRCHSETHPAYPRYGGRGITVAERWRRDPRAFIEWVEANIGAKPDGLSLDRIDNDRGYEPGNLRWATPRQQIRNSRSAKLSQLDVDKIRAEHEGGLVTQTALAQKFGVSRRTIGMIVHRDRWA